jgi:hypothetical protein
VRPAKQRLPLTVPVSVNCAWTLDRYEKLPVRAFMPFTQFNGYPGCSYKIGYTLFDLSGKRVRINPKEHGTVKEKVLRYFSDLLKKTGEVQQVETVLIERQDIVGKKFNSGTRP